VLTDNGKQFTDRFGKGGEVLFDRIWLSSVSRGRGEGWSTLGGGGSGL
jgi:hypothetical protein